MQDRHRERRGFAGAGLRNPDHVAARQNDRNGLRLNRRGRDIFLFSERACDRFAKAEIMKRGQSTSFLLCETARPQRRTPQPQSRMVQDTPA